MKKSYGWVAILLMALVLVSFGWTAGAYAADESGSVVVSCRMRPTISVTVSPDKEDYTRNCSIVVKANCSWIMVVDTGPGPQASFASMIPSSLENPLPIYISASSFVIIGRKPGITRISIPVSGQSSSRLTYSISPL